MIVCVCKAIGHKQIEQELEKGVCSLEKICEKTGAGTGCGICQEKIESLINENSDAQSADVQMALEENKVS